MFTKLACLIATIVLIVGCSSKPEPKEKADLEAIKENRQGLDYQEQRADIFHEIDTTLQAWHLAQSQRDHAYASALEQNLYELACGHFSKLVEALTGSDSFARTVAAAAIGFSEDIRAIPYLLKALQTSDVAIRKYAAFSLGHIGSNQTQMALLYQVLAQDANDEVRSMVAFAISRIVTREKDEGALPHLLKAVTDRASQVRAHAVIALGKVGHQEGAHAIIASTLQDPEDSVRFNSVWALRQIGGKEVVAPLIKTLRDRSPAVQQAAHMALTQVTRKDFGNDAKKWEEWAGIAQ
jgi:HEAT repeat protein